MRKQHIKRNYLIGGISIGLFCLLLIALLFPNVDKESYAVDCAPGEEPCTTMMAETAVDLMVASTVSVALQSNVELNVLPKSNGSFAETTSKLTVATNNPSGYAVYMQAGTVTNGKANLISSDLSNAAVISPVNGVVDSGNFSPNTWGYSLDGEKYQAVPATTGIIKETSSTTFNDTYDLSFGVNIDTNLPAGQYTNSVTISAVANPIVITSLSQLTYMQDMTADICTNTAEHVTKRLIDTRDGKSYWVAKLKDGNCWMTQNLALDLSTNKALTPADSDVEESWTPGANTNAEKLTGTRGDANFTSEYSWDLGKVVTARPVNRERCVNYGTADAAISDDNLGEVCRQEGAVDVSGAEWQPTFISQAGVFNGESYDYVTVDEVNKTYDAHYLIGNYYQYNTATAGSGAGITEKNQNAKDSICSKGWRLPVSGADASGAAIVNPNEAKGSFYQLFAAYGYKDSNFTGGNEEVLLSELDVNSQKNVLVSPIYIVPAGIITLNYGYLRNFPINASLLTSTTYSSTHDLFLTVGSTVNPVVHDSKHYGYSVRCLAK